MKSPTQSLPWHNDVVQRHQDRDPYWAVPWEEEVEVDFERKRLTYSDPAAECKQAGWGTITYPVEVECCGFVGTSAFCLLRDIGVTASNQQRAPKDGALYSWRGWEEQLFALVEEKGEVLEVKTNPRSSCKWWQGDVPATAAPPGDVLRQALLP